MKKINQNRQSLEKKLALIAKDFSFGNKKELRASLFEQIELERSPLIERIRILSKEFTLTRGKKFLIKEILLSSIGNRQKSFDWAGLLSFNWLRQSVAVAMLFVFAFVIGLNPWSEQSRVQAANLAYFAQLDGLVKVIRNGEEIIVKKGMKVNQDDRIFVGPDSKLEINFYNDNVLRLAENSELSIKELVKPDKKNVIVNLELDKGQGWFRVVDASDVNSEFKVKANDLLVSANKEVGFDLKVTPEFSRVVAIDNELSIVLNHNQQLIATSLMPEKMIKVRSKTPFISYQEQKQFEGQVENNELDWFERNLVSDRVHRNEVERRWRDLIADKAGLTPDDTLYPLKEFKRKAHLALTFDDFSKEEVKLVIAKQKFYEAHASLDAGQQEVAENLLAEYKEEVEAVREKVIELTDQDLEKSQDLKKSLEEDLVEQKQSLIAFKDESAFEKAHFAIGKAELITEAVEPEILDPELELEESFVESSEEVLPVELKVEESTNIIENSLQKLDVIVEEVDVLKEAKEKTGTNEIEEAQLKIELKVEAEIKESVENLDLDDVSKIED